MFLVYSLVVFILPSCVLSTADNLVLPPECGVIFKYPKMIHLDSIAKILKSSVEIQLITNKSSFSLSNIDIYLINSVPTRSKLLLDKRMQASTILASTCSVNSTNFPYETALCTFEFATWQNSSSVRLVPIFITGSLQDIGTSEWSASEAYAYTQGYVDDTQEYEIVSFAIHFERYSSNLRLLVPWTLLSINVLQLLASSGLMFKDEKGSQKSAHLAEIVIGVYCMHMSPSNHNFTSKPVQQWFFFFCLNVGFQAILHMLPTFMVIMRCTPPAAHPNPSSVPLPHEQYSLDSERRSLLDSARSPRESCAAEVRLTLHTINEVVDRKSEAVHQQRLFNSTLQRYINVLCTIFFLFNIVLTVFTLV